VKIAILSDIHSNIDALEAVAKDAKEWGACQWLVVGDIVGYGAAPSECIDLLKNLGASSIAGNHDWGVIEKTSISYFNSAARQAVLWTREHLSAGSRGYLEDLPLTLTHGEIRLSHADFTNPASWEYVFTLYQARRQFDGFATRLGVIGHSHVPFIVQASEKDGRVEQVMGESVKWERGSRYLINAGSVGQPRDGDPRACYLRVDCSGREIAFRRVTYDVAEAQRRISQAGLPSSLAERLPLGR
jgi:diadenosine tetraphosphatase ApaH/serine/threonine PP2A family protein phosphatase